MKIKHKPRPHYGTTRKRTKFLWWPKRIWNETRWMERASWREEWYGENWYGEEWIDK